MKIIRTLSPELVTQIRDYINATLLPQATSETAKCARGRKQLWLEAKPIYSNRTYVSAIHDERLWSFVKRTFPDVDLAQVYFGNRGIDWHRDAAYANSQAYIINLGICTLQTKLNDGTLISHELTGGELIEFNSKLEHRCIDVHPERIGIGCWSAKIPIQF